MGFPPNFCRFDQELTSDAALQHYCCTAARAAATASTRQRQEQNIMSKTTKSSAAAVAGAQVETFLSAYLGAWKKSVDILVDGYKQTAQTQTELAEIAAQRGRVAAKLASENVSSVSKTIAGVVAVFDDLAGYAGAAQKQAADFAASQHSTAYAAAQQQFEAASARAAETFQRGLDTLLESQARVLGNQTAA
jgi:hypothetical protein